MLTIDTHFIRAPLRLAEKHGQDIPSLLLELDISPDIFEQKNTLVHAQQYVKLIQRLWEVSGDEYWGLSPSPCKPGHFALLVRYLLQFDTLKALLSETCRFYNVTREEWFFSVLNESGRVSVHLDVDKKYQALPSFLIEFIAVCIHRLMCWLTDTRIPVLEYHFSYPQPKNFSAYKVIFPGVCIFDSEHNGFVIDEQYLTLPQTRDWQEARIFLQESPAGLMVTPGSDNSYTAKIKAILLETLGKDGNVPDFDRVALRLNVSSPTLRRKLKAESNSYQDIKDTMRRDIAIDKLVRESVSVTELGLQLGFVEPSSFTRAFKQWTGLSPQQYRSTKD